jgi:hypothetical protein
VARKPWLKFWVDPWLRKKIHQEPVAVRGTFATLLALAGDSPYADDGIIKLVPGKGFSDSDMALLLNIDVRTWQSHKPRLVELNLIKVSQENEIAIVNWGHYQSAYRSRKRRQEKKSDTMSDTVSDTMSIPETETDPETEGREKNDALRPDDVDNSVKKPEHEIQDLANQILIAVGESVDSRFRSYYLALARKLPSGVIYRSISAMKAADQEGRINGTRGAYLNGILRKEIEAWK